MTVNVILDTQSYQRKPTSTEPGRIRNRIKRSSPREATLESIVTAMEAGKTIQPGTKEAGQQLFFLDFDNKDTYLQPEEAVDIAKKKGTSPCFAYETFSSTEDKKRFRVVFCADCPVTDEATRKACIRFLESLYNGATDPACRDLTRLFYGTNRKAFYRDLTATFSVEEVKRWSQGQVQKEPGKEPGKKTNPVSLKRSCSGNVEAIRENKPNYIREKLKPKAREFDNLSELKWFIGHEINLAQLLGVPEGRSFCCLFHDDHNPSASVFRTQSGAWKYKCHSSAKCVGVLGTLQVIEKLGRFKSWFKAVDFIKKAYNLSVRETEWSIEQNANIDHIATVFSDTDVDERFSDICPTAAENTRYSAELFLKILTLAKSCIYPDKPQDGGIVFYMSARQLQSIAKRGNTQRVAQHLKLLIYHRMIDICTDDQVPPEMLQRAKRQADENKHNPIQFFRIPSWVIERLEEIESAGIRWKYYGYRLKAVSFEMFYRAEGEEVARWLYPNFRTKNPMPGQFQEMVHDTIEKALIDLVRSCGFCTEKQLVELSEHRLNCRKLAERQTAKVIPELLKTYNLHKVKSNKELKTRFDIPGNGYPVIIVPDEEGE